MKNRFSPVIIVLLVAGAAVFGTGTTFKTMHWPGGKMIQLLGAALIVAGLFSVLVSQLRKK